MKARQLITRAAIGAGAGGMLAATLLAGGAASADSTAPCQTNPNCFEPVFAVAQQGGAAADFTQADDAALTVQGPVTAGTAVYSRIRNGFDNGTQDWSYVQVDTVPASGPGGYGFTSFDNTHYAGKAVVQVEATPYGQDTGLCLNFGRNTNAGSLQACGTGKGQAFILSHFAIGINSPAGGAYDFALVARQANTTARHYAVTGQADGFGQVTAQRLINHSPGAATDQMLSALP